MQATSVIVHGPQGCGKTRNAATLMKHFGCMRVLDEAHFRSLPWLKSEAVRMPTLFLSSEKPPLADGTHRHVRVIPYATAAKAAGIQH